jgi:hypothetical protein
MAIFRTIFRHNFTQKGRRMTEIICISGALAKKDTVAKILKEELKNSKKRVLITYFADPLRQICRSWFGWDGKNDPEGRSLLQYVGTNIVRSRKPDFWVDFTLNLLAMMGDEWDFVIIPDCRHANELDLERYGYQPRHIRVEGRGAPPSPGAADFTISEAAQLHTEIAKIAGALLYD